MCPAPSIFRSPYTPLITCIYMMYPREEEVKRNIQEREISAADLALVRKGLNWFFSIAERPKLDSFVPS